MRKEIFVGKKTLHTTDSSKIRGEYLRFLGDEFYCIRNYDRMPPFFMSIVSSSDHWMFISSSGGLSAGRSNAESALFPYYTDDRITENQPNTGPVSILRITIEGKTQLWEPFSTRYEGLYQIERNIYKNELGNQLVFEEINPDLNLTYRTIWRTSEKFGFVKTSWLKNMVGEDCFVEILDGLQNLLPYGANTALQNTFSNLLNAYKRSELEPEAGLGIFTLSSSLTDLAEPSESLKATVAWQFGLDNPCYILSNEQLDSFRTGEILHQEIDIRGLRGAYLIHSSFELSGDSEKEWDIVTDVNQDSRNCVELVNRLKRNPLELKNELHKDIDAGSSDLRRIVASADGLQVSEDHLITAHHLSNVLFNCMRGGIFVDNYLISKDDFLEFANIRNQTILDKYPQFFASLPDKISFNKLTALASDHIPASRDLQRICYEYLPITFSRRHGDPSRPWNKFSINVKKTDGTRRLDYQGNWRDIFQNWEPLAWSYPEFIEGMISKFLNATTADGYNPYRVTRDGIEWEIPTPNDPWANIGYWGDHQIVYLENLLEISHKFHPGRLLAMFSYSMFSYANVPYHIKPYQAMLKDPFSTISFDWNLEDQIQAKVKTLGTDGRLILDSNDHVFHVNMLEKLLTLLLAKLTNFVPDGGIWMNTQRPEWNDANNALVGKGLSVVTLGYLRRFIVFFIKILSEDGTESYVITKEISEFFSNIHGVLLQFSATLHENACFNPEQRRQFMDTMGNSASHYRSNFYKNGFSGESSVFQKNTLQEFLSLALEFIEKSLKVNRRSDNLYHSYNILELTDGCAHIGFLDEMLEGQVSILSSGLLTGAEAANLLESLRKSRLFRSDQHSYILYPDRDLPGFLHKNLIKQEMVDGSKLIVELIKNKDQSLITRDENGDYHFNGMFRNARDVKAALEALRKAESYRSMVDSETETILDLFEKIFNHKAFTGRSGTFFAYEGLGSIYWHMVSKLLLAVQEIYLHSSEIHEQAATLEALAFHYYDIRSGLGYNKSPAVYGAFPTDPYSHTPAGQGAKQPGMTGQVKEEILVRLHEIGVFVDSGRISFNPQLLRDSEFSIQPRKFEYFDVNGNSKSIDLVSGSCACTFCQVPLVIEYDKLNRLQVKFTDGDSVEFDGNVLDAEISSHIFNRDNQIQQITFYSKMK
jgi:hypothetical protein